MRQHLNVYFMCTCIRLLRVCMQNKSMSTIRRYVYTRCPLWKPLFTMQNTRLHRNKQNLTNLGCNKVKSIYLSPKYQRKFLYSVYSGYKTWHRPYLIVNRSEGTEFLWIYWISRAASEFLYAETEKSGTFTTYRSTSVLYIQIHKFLGVVTDSRQNFMQNTLITVIKNNQRRLHI